MPLNFAKATVFLIALTFFGCSKSDGYKDIRNYYFPLKQLTDGLVYEYQPLGKTLPGQRYIYYRSLIRNEEVHLATTIYGDLLIPEQLSNERMQESGMVLEELFLFPPDTTRPGKQLQIPVTIDNDDVFPFRVRPNGGIFLYAIRWEPAEDPGAEIRLIKNRRYLRDTSFSFQGTTYPALIFEVKELLEYDKEGVLEQRFDGSEIYAEGIGLVYYQKTVSEELYFEYRLADRFPMTELEKRFQELYE